MQLKEAALKPAPPEALTFFAFRAPSQLVTPLSERA